MFRRGNIDSHLESNIKKVKEYHNEVRVARRGQLFILDSYLPEILRIPLVLPISIVGFVRSPITQSTVRVSHHNSVFQSFFCLIPQSLFFLRQNQSILFFPLTSAVSFTSIHQIAELLQQFRNTPAQGLDTCQSCLEL